MHKTITLSLFLALMVLSSLPVVAANLQGRRHDLKDGYENIEVRPFDVRQGVDFPDEYVRTMMAAVVKDLRGIKKFRRVLVGSETQGSDSAPTIQLVGTVTKFQHGNRGKRLISMGLAGDTIVVAHVKFIDKTSGQVLIEADVDGLIYTGFLGGSPKGAPSGVGKDVAQIAKKVFF